MEILLIVSISLKIFGSQLLKFVSEPPQKKEVASESREDIWELEIIWDNSSQMFFRHFTNFSIIRLIL